jgi:hypothetical protein
MVALAKQKRKESKGTEMTQKDDIPNKSLLLELEDAVLKIEAAGYTDEDIFAFVNMIMKGFIRDGAFAPEYMQMVADLIEQRKREMSSRTIDTPPGIIIASR